MKYLNSLVDKTNSSCGPVSLYNLSLYKNKKNNLKRLALKCKEKDGKTYSSDLTNAIRNLSFESKHIKNATASTAIQHLNKGFPLILLHFEQGEGHYIFIHDFKENGISLIEHKRIRHLMSKLKHNKGEPELWLIF